MTYPPPLTPASAARAQASIAAGSGRCHTCHIDVWRYSTSSDPERLIMFTEAAGGSFEFPLCDKTYPVAKFVGKGRGCLAHHNCIEDS
jgi:hypothetical protein